MTGSFWKLLCSLCCCTEWSLRTWSSPDVQTKDNCCGSLQQSLSIQHRQNESKEFRYKLKYIFLSFSASGYIRLGSSHSSNKSNQMFTIRAFLHQIIFLWLHYNTLYIQSLLVKALAWENICLKTPVCSQLRVLKRFIENQNIW